MVAEPCGRSKRSQLPESSLNDSMNECHGEFWDWLEHNMSAALSELALVHRAIQVETYAAWGKGKRKTRRTMWAWPIGLRRLLHEGTLRRNKHTHACQLNPPAQMLPLFQPPCFHVGNRWMLRTAADWGIGWRAITPAANARYPMPDTHTAEAPFALLHFALLCLSLCL